MRQLDTAFVNRTLGLPIVPDTKVETDPPALPGVPAATQPLPCVDGRQTSDPLSPPCVAEFRGDNGGRTYRGVSRDEVRVLVRFSGNLSSPEDSPVFFAPHNRLYDLGAAPTGAEPYRIKFLRRYQQYFNDRYQTYGRQVRFFGWFDGGADSGAAVNFGRGVARALLNEVQPFAFVDNSVLDYASSALLRAFASEGVPGFDNGLLSQGLRGDGMLWGYDGSADERASRFASYVCSKVVGEPAVWSGNAGENGRKRRIGILHVKPVTRELEVRDRFYRLAESAIRRCAGSAFVADASYETPVCANNSFLTDPFFTTSLVGASSQTVGGPAVTSLRAMKKFKTKGVTTVVWMGCEVESLGTAMTALNYFPEWIANGDGGISDAQSPVYSGTALAWHRRAVVISSSNVQPRLADAQCYRALREVDPSLPTSYVDRIVLGFSGLKLPYTPVEIPYRQARDACSLYPVLRLLFTGIQRADARLTPQSLALGLRSLGYVSGGGDPEFPSCYYGNGDDACVQDSMAMYWDAQQQCYRAIERGRRYRAGEWPAGNIDAQITGTETCNFAA